MGWKVLGAAQVFDEPIYYVVNACLTHVMSSACLKQSSSLNNDYDYSLEPFGRSLRALEMARSKLGDL